MRLAVFIISPSIFALVQVQRRGAGLSFGYRSMFHGMSLIHASGALLAG